MDFVSLRYFVEVVRQRNVTKAAALLNVAQPAVTRRMHQLEESFGVPLLMRRRHGVIPTEAGTIVFERAERVLRLAGEMQNDVLSRTAEPAGQLRFGFPPSVGNVFAVSLVSDFLRRFPRVSVQLHEHFSPAMREALIGGRIDMGIMSCEAAHPDLHYEPLFQEGLWLIGLAADWPFRRTGMLELRRLVDKPLLLASLLRLTLERTGAEKGLSFNVRLEADALTTVCEAVRRGVGFLVGPPSSVSREIGRGEFVGAPIRGLRVTRGLYRHRDRPVTQALRELTDATRAEAGRLLRDHPKMFQPVAVAA